MSSSASSLEEVGRRDGPTDASNSDEPPTPADTGPRRGPRPDAAALPLAGADFAEEPYGHLLGRRLQRLHTDARQLPARLHSEGVRTEPPEFNDRRHDRDGDRDGRRRAGRLRAVPNHGPLRDAPPP